MSHLSILPTVLRDADCLAATLRALGLDPRRGGELHGFNGAAEAVALSVALPEGQRIGWRRERDGSLALVGDLQRLSRSRDLQALLGRITRDYAARAALQEAGAALPEAIVQLGG
jgi:hypothetical protein